MAVQLTCQVCGYQTNAVSPAHAAHAFRRHNCDKRLEQAERRNAAVRAQAERPVRECTHPNVKHRHGTLTMYIRDRCRCEPCTRAVMRAEKRRRLDGRPAYVDTAPAVEHIRKLSEAGIGWVRAARLGGVHNGTLSRILYGHGGKPPTGRARRETVEKILAIPVPDITDLGKRTPVPAHGTRRRLQALITLGWTIKGLALEAGVQKYPLEHALKKPTTGAATAIAVRDLYDRLWNTPPPERTPTERRNATASRNRARAEGWLPPLAYDDGELDNPSPLVDRWAAMRVDRDTEEAA